MRKHYIDVDGYWGIVFCYDYDWRDVDEMCAIMDSFGMQDSEIRKAVRILFGINTGMTVSRSDLAMSVVFVSEASSFEQFMDTCAHELDHVQDAILDFYNISQGTEKAAWLQGYMMRRLSRFLRDDETI